MLPIYLRIVFYMIVGFVVTSITISFLSLFSNTPLGNIFFMSIGAWFISYVLFTFILKKIFRTSMEFSLVSVLSISAGLGISFLVLKVL